MINNLFSQDQVKIDSLQAFIKQHPHDTTTIEALRHICWEYEGVDNAAYMLYARKAHALAIELNSSSSIANCLMDIGIVHDYMGNSDSTIYYYKKSLDIYKKTGDQDGVSAICLNIAAAYRTMGNFSEALSYLFQGAKISEAAGNKERLADCKSTMGNVYRQKQNYKLALKFLSEALLLHKEVKDLEGESITHNNIGIVYSEMEDHALALEHYLASLKIREQLGLQLAMATSYSCIGCEYFEMDDFRNALKFHEMALKINERLKNKKGIAIDFTNIAAVNTKQNNYSEAIAKLKIAEAIATQVHFRDLLKEIYMTTAENYEKLNNYQAAYAFYRKYSNMKDSMINEQENSLIAEMNSKYESEKKDSEIKLLNKNKEIQRADLKKKSVIIWGACVVIVLVLFLAFYIYRSYRLKQKANEVITFQKQEVEKQKEIIEEKRKEITDSIQYAKRIQGALLASDTFLKKHLPEHFILYKPKDIVSGDFYWSLKTDDGKLLFATGDCTGHGVPGAFMSLLGINFLNEIVAGKKITQPDLIFNHLRDEIIHALNPEGGDMEASDGMDAVLCRFDFTTLKMEFAAANNPLWLIRGGELIEYPCNKMPIGKYYDEIRFFTLNTIQLQKGDIVYTFTDGYSDQFGGEKGKKFKYKSLQKLLLTIHSLSMADQRTALDEAIEKWKGDYEQIDDILVIGVKI
jgi:serine phosphatase RsbU (regulator of sigma subunit)/tetratricopeptide (TPR) repeat protein